jgi:acyl-CoA dehydrogenase
VTALNGYHAHDLRQLRQQVRAFLAEAVASGQFVPRVDSWLSAHSPAFSRELGKRGWIGPSWPVEYGGRGAPELARFLITEELLAAGAPVAAHWVSQRQVGPLLLKYGTDEQRRRFLPAIARGECFFAICMSEPDAGSDLASVQTSAARGAGGWRVTGRKIWSSHAHASDYGMLLCRTAAPENSRHEGLSQMIVDLRAPGLTIRPIRVLSGEAHFAEIAFDEVFVPDAQVVGAIGAGWSQVMAELAYERSGPERFLSTMPLILGFIRSLRASTDPAAAESVGRLAAQFWSLRQMSIDITVALQRGEAQPDRAALVKDVGTRFEQASIDAISDMLRIEPDPSGADPLGALLAQAIFVAPTFTLRGGTNEILRGIVARSLVS